MSKYVLTGFIVKNVALKTVKVRVELVFMHPLYYKIVRSYKKYLVHDEHNMCKVGDVVNFVLCKPISSRKRWKIV